MSLGHITRWVILVCIIVLAGWTSIAAIWGLPGDTVSETVRAFCGRYPIVPFAVGLMVAHWLW